MAAIQASRLPRPSLRASLRSALRAAVVQGNLAPGQRLSEVALAHEYGVSRTPLREALIGLEREGFVEHAPGQGFVVRELEIDEVHEIYPIIDVLESKALELAPRASSDRLAELERINAAIRDSAQMESFEERVSRRVELDRTWHLTLLAACPNRRLTRMLDSLYSIVARYEHAYWTGAGSDPYSAADHDEILRAVAAHDVALASQLLRGHWQKGIAVIAEQIRKSRSSGP